MTRDDLVQLALLALAAVAAAHVASLGGWVVDDAAIAWAFARNWADGHGLVPFVGGERVEGYSDFLWVAAIALADRLGVDAWVAAKALGTAFTVATIPFVYRLGAAAVPSRPTLAGLTAAALFAVDTQVAIFAASGLENALFSFLLAVGLAGTTAELRSQRTPWSALAFLGIAVTRPEGIVYAAFAGLVALLGTDRDRRGAARIGVWLALFWVPFLGYHAVRYAYFAWPFPMTYYAKVDDGASFGLLDARSRGWAYLAGYLHELGRVPALPLLVAGRTGVAGRRAWALGAAVAVGLAATFLPLPPVAFAGLWVASGVLLALPGLGGRGADGVTAACWGMGLLSTSFAVYAQGDWMGAYRWLSFAAVPFAVLAGAGVAHLGDLLEARVPRLGAALAAVTVLAAAVVNARHTAAFARAPDISAFTVRGRAGEATDHWRRLHVDDRPRLFTIDMGGFLWFTDWELMDLVGLVDVTFAIQGHRRKLVAEDWIFRERRPHLAFLSEPEAAWLRRRDGADDAYVHLGGQEEIRRDLLFAASWDGPGPRLDLGEVVVHGLSAPGTAVSDAIWVEMGLSTPTRDPFAVQLLLADADGTPRASWTLPLGAGLVPPERWRPDEVALGRWHVDLPDDVGPGTWQLGLRVIVDGAARTPATVPEGVSVDATGAVWPGTTVEVVTRPEAEAAADAAVASLPADCDAAERVFYLARRRFPDPRPFEAKHGARVRAALASCRAAAAATSPDPVAALERARTLDPDAPGVAEAVAARAQDLNAACDAAEVAGEWRACARACDDAVRLEPTRSWARRTAERCRDRWYTAEERARKASR